MVVTIMLDFRLAAAANNTLDLERLSHALGDDFKIDEPGPKSGKTAAHVASERAHFKAIYWLFEKGADFHCEDNAGKTPLDYLQQKELTSLGSKPMLIEDRKYHLCNAHYKIWLAHDPEIFMPYLYQDDFRQYREKNPDGYISLVYSEALLSKTALSDLITFAEKYRITLISFEKDLAKLTEHYGTEEDKQCYELAKFELSQYPEQKGGNLAVVADLIRWSSVLLRKGSYTDTDVEIGQHQWTNSISMEKPFALNLGSLVYPNNEVIPWLNGDMIAVSSLFSRPHLKSNFRITLSKAACFILKKVQLSLLSNSQKKQENRIAKQQFFTATLLDFSPYLKDYFKQCYSDRDLTENFSPIEINKIQKEGLELFSQEEKNSIIERVAKLQIKIIEDTYDTPEEAHKYSNIFRNAKSDEYRKILKNYMQAIQMTHIKESVNQLTGTYVFGKSVWECIKSDDWKIYSIHSHELIQSAFRSTNTVKFNTNNEENERSIKFQKYADLSFTPFGMLEVLQRSEALKAKHKNN